MRRALFAVVLVCRASYAEPVLHERVYFGAEAARCKNGVCVTRGPLGPEVSAVEQDGHLLQAPSDGAAPLPGEQIFHPEPEAQQTSVGGPPLPGDPPPERRGHVEMDRATGADVAVSHTYHAVFSPSEFPFKRISALDWADDAERLAVFDATKRPLPVLGTDARRTDYDAFWGSIVVDLEPDRWVPIPSVAADARILTWRTQPAVAPGALEFARDAADNQYVRATRTGGAGGQRRLVWLTDASQDYFGGPIRGALLDDEPRALLHALPAALKRKADEVLAKLGVHRGRSTPLEEVLYPLVSHFRAFEAGDLPPATVSTYRDLALGQRGVCRHRSYAFLITALAAGIPARYVENELHVFVEVYVPHAGWRRINLGGAAADEQLAGGDERPIHHPRGEDSLPRPPQYAANAMPPDHRKTPQARSGSGEGLGDGSGRSHGQIDLASMLDDDARVTPGAPKRIASHMRIAVAERTVFRGDTIDVSGEILDGNGAPLADLPVEIYLDSATGAERVGASRTAQDGRFGVAALVPAALQLGRYTVVARTPGDSRRAPSASAARVEE